MIWHMSEKTFCVANLRNSSFSIQVDESTNLAIKCHVAFVRFLNEGRIQENFLCSKELHETSK